MPPERTCIAPALITGKVKLASEENGSPTTDGTTLACDPVAEHDARFGASCAAGGTTVGRTNTPAFSYGWFASNALHGITLNPLNLDRTPGGLRGQWAPHASPIHTRRGHSRAGRPRGRGARPIAWARIAPGP